MSRGLIVGTVALALAGIAFAYWYVLGPRTTVVEGIEGPANGMGSSFTVASQIPLDDLAPGFKNRIFRMRYWDIYPGGVVPIHSHRARPATIYVVNGEIYEYRNGHIEPVVHQGGQISVESEGLVHHWLNDTAETIHLVATDIYAGRSKGKKRRAPERLRSFAPDHMPSGLDEEIMAQIDLSSEALGVEGFFLRTRRLSLAPGGRSQLERFTLGPGNVYVLEGAVMESRSDRQSDLALGKDDVSDFVPGVSLIWRNEGPVPAVLIVTDVIGADEAAQGSTAALARRDAVTNTTAQNRERAVP